MHRFLSRLHNSLSSEHHFDCTTMCGYQTCRVRLQNIDEWSKNCKGCPPCSFCALYVQKVILEPTSLLWDFEEAELFCAAPKEKEDIHSVLARTPWRTQAEFEGPVRVLQWTGIGSTKVEWPRQYAVLHCGQVYVLDKKLSASPISTQNIYTER